MWHGAFRVAELVCAFAVRLETAGTPYQLYPVVHISKLKPVREFPSRPATQLTMPVEERLDFDEGLLPEDSWEATRELEDNVFEGYPDTTWVDELDLNCGGLLYDFLRERTGRHRFEAMQSHENAEAAEPDGVPVGGITGSKKGTAGELPADPLEAALEDEARDDEEVDESSSLESPELPGPGPDPPLAAMWPLGEECADCTECTERADPAERVDAKEAEHECECEPDRGRGGVWERDGERGG
ncbi:hypothetical protein PR001_g24708 [Phytophthora rubi]|uniref:AGC-kinase C-terminal domain-containing protein n=1 Tax=Phytophthora rubi TaxID=129364 RepID=A0A6A3I7V3_9STRA|nr:hypothetical protein PR001_g24708 [Phytophthora rubi]